MPSNNPNGNANLRPFNSSTASAAGKKSAATRRARKLAMDLHQREDITRATRTVQEWLDTYERDQLGEVAAATAQHCMMLVLNGQVPLDGRALAQLMETATTIARLEAGMHTSATLHATINSGDALDRIRELRARATEPGGLAPHANTPHQLEPIEVAGPTETETTAHSRTGTPPPPGDGTPV